ncbi:MAG: SPOR domain-containing protein [Bacteroidales bacterium]|nr:SPOR domain-containing protein [Bacteroidales bacterium]
MKIKFFVVLAFALIVNLFNINSLYAQRAIYDISELGIFPEDNCTASAKIQCESDLKTIESNIILGNRKKQAYGYSVQIYFGAGSDAQTKAEKSVKEFRRSFPDEDATIVYEAPYFKVHAGNCRSRLEATKLKKAVESQFPGCFIVECKINYPKL